MIAKFKTVKVKKKNAKQMIIFVLKDNSHFINALKIFNHASNGKEVFHKMPKLFQYNIMIV